MVSGDEQDRKSSGHQKRGEETRTKAENEERIKEAESHIFEYRSTLLMCRK